MFRFLLTPFDSICVFLCHSAQFAGLLCEEQGSDADNVKYCGYCKYHHSKLVSGVILYVTFHIFFSVTVHTNEQFFSHYRRLLCILLCHNALIDLKHTCTISLLFLIVAFVKLRKHRLERQCSVLLN